MVKSIKCKVHKNGTTTKIDLSFYPIYKQYKWHLNSKGYVVANINKNGKRKTIFLHHMVMNFKYSKKHNLVVDHKYHNLLDNREKKLRIVSISINNKNRNKIYSNTNIEFT